MYERTRQLHPLRTLHLFAGAGGGILADLLQGHIPVCAVEIEPYCLQVLHQRQEDGILPWFPLYDDVTTFSGKRWRGLVDVLAGGFPCQDISVAGKGAGLSGERSGMWFEMARIIGEICPRHVIIENSPMLASPRGIKGWLLQVVDSLFGKIRHRREITLKNRPDVLQVLEDLSEMGYHAKWGIIGAHQVRAPHKRDRIWIVATHAMCQGRAQCGTDQADAEAGGCGGDLDRGSRGHDRRKSGAGQNGRLANPSVRRCKEQWAQSAPAENAGEQSPDVSDPDQLRGQISSQRQQPGEQLAESDGGEAGAGGQHWWATEPDVGRVANGVASRVDRLRALGNGQVPAVAALAWEILTNLTKENEQK